MSVKVRCTGCEKVLTVPDTARGKAIKCPSCDTRVAVPAGSDKPAKKAAKKQDSEDALASFDLRHAADHDARICTKCGYDMSHLDEETTECPKCGTDTETGGLGEKARKKLLKGPDPDKFYASLWGQNWRFVGKNQGLAWRTMIYLTIASVLCFLCIFLYLYIPMWPPRVFFSLCILITAMVIPGWLWFLDQEIIKATLEKKEKLKRINFDFFLASFLGIMFIAWHVVFALPVMLIPTGICAAMSWMGSVPWFVTGIVAAVSYFPVLAMMPLALGHMVMVVPTPGWMFWKVVPGWLRTLKPTLLWLMLVLFTQLPAIGCLATIGAVYGPSLNTMARTMESNAELYRIKLAAENAPKAKADAPPENPRLKESMQPVAYSTLTVPILLWMAAIILGAFPAVYAMRLNGQIIYYFRDNLDLITLAKEYKYVSKPKEDEQDKKPKTLQEVLVESIVICIAFMVLGTIFGVIRSMMTDDNPMVESIVDGIYKGLRFAFIVGIATVAKEAWEYGVMWGLIVWTAPTALILAVVCLFIAAMVPPLRYVAMGMLGLASLSVIGAMVFTKEHWEETRGGCLTCIISWFLQIVMLVTVVAGVVSMNDVIGFGGGEEEGGGEIEQAAPLDPNAGAAPAAPQQPAAPGPGGGMPILPAAPGLAPIAPM